MIPKLSEDLEILKKHIKDNAWGKAPPYDTR